MAAGTDIKKETIETISSYIFNFPMAERLYQSIETGLRIQPVHFAGGNTVWDVFKQSLDAAVKNIEEDPRPVPCLSRILSPRILRIIVFFLAAMFTVWHIPISSHRIITVVSEFGVEWGYF